MPAKQNQLLAALPSADFERLLPHLEPVALEPGSAIYESRSDDAYVYFPIAGNVSLQHVTLDDSPAEIAVVGNEGVVGIAVFMGGEATPGRAVVQSAGRGYRLKASLLKQEFERHGSLQLLVLRYMQSLVSQMTQAVASYRQHSRSRKT